MKYIIVDFEMNSIASNLREQRRISKMEIIQIGAVVLNDEYDIIGSFSTYVKPQFNRFIEYKYQELTGISTYTVKDAPVFDEAIKMFFKWVQSYNEPVEIYAWSENDLDQICKEAELKEYVFTEEEDHLLDCWYDFQEEFGERTSRRRCALLEALLHYGIGFEGRQHDGLNDAINTAKLFKAVRNDENIAKKYSQYLNQESSNTLGDLFDFSKLGYSFS